MTNTVENLLDMLELACAEHQVAYYRCANTREEFLALTADQIVHEIEAWTETRCAAYLFATYHADSLSKGTALTHKLLDHLRLGDRPTTFMREVMRQVRADEPTTERGNDAS